MSFHGQPPYRILRARGESITRKFRRIEHLLHAEFQQQLLVTELRGLMRAFFAFAASVDLYHSEVPHPQGTQRLHEAAEERRQRALDLLNELDVSLAGFLQVLLFMKRLRGRRGRPGLRAKGRQTVRGEMEGLREDVDALEEFAREGESRSQSESEENK